MSIGFAFFRFRQRAATALRALRGPVLGADTVPPLQFGARASLRSLGHHPVRDPLYA
jgi:hypothetical protein